MTSAEAGPLAADAEPDDETYPAPAVGTEDALWETPWSPNDGRRRGNGSPPGSIPGTPAANPSQQNGAASGATAPPGVTAPGARAPGAAAPAPGTTGSTGTPPGTPGPAVAAPPGQPVPAPPPAAENRPAEREEPENGGLPVDPEMLSTMAPMALMAGAGLLPILGSALSGLLGGGGSGGGETAEGQMSPEAQKALEALDLLAEVYGDGPTDDPQVKKLREELGLTDADGSGAGGSSGGSGETAQMIKARQLFQKNAATAFNNLDNQLANYIKRLSGNNSVDKKAVKSLIREVNVALAELGPEAYTKEGQQKVRAILTRALQKAHGIVSGGQATADETASAIDKLTNQYLYNLAGQEVPAGYMNFGGGTVGALSAGGSEKARRAVQEALAQQGDPYVWGAEGPSNFDCSGLTQYAAKAAGVNIPRVAADQYRSLPKVPANQIQPGDLIFPSSSFDSGGPGHVMMYIGDGKVVHAPKTGDVVRVAALPSSYQAARWA
ncbi:C40 family peptidase [Nocardia sp. NPDC051750]|uniref:C40 family peptidase n=1 Tax=Nocardia sp. NPDC051750 TaxID=3364325 RepID=UPI00378A3C67